MLALGAVFAADAVGLAVALAGGAGLGDALVIGTPTNAPFTFVAVQALMALAVSLAVMARNANAAEPINRARRNFSMMPAAAGVFLKSFVMRSLSFDRLSMSQSGYAMQVSCQMI